MPTYSYATIAQVRTYLPQVATGASSDALLADVLKRARGMVDSALTFSFFNVDVSSGAVDSWPAAATRLITAVPSDHWLKLPPYQQGSITNLSYYDNGTLTALTDWIEDWVTSGPFYLFRAADTSTTPPTVTELWNQSPYSVTAVWGFGPPPAVVEEVTLELAVNIWRSRERGSFTEVQGQNGAYVKAIGALSKEQRATLEEVRRDYVDWIDWGRG